MKIETLIKESGLTQKQLAIDSKLSHKTLADWVDGRRIPTEKSINKIKNGLLLRAFILIRLCNDL